MCGLLVNSVFSAAAVYFEERYLREKSQVFPKVLGGCPSMFLNGACMVIYPHYRLYMVPYFLIPLSLVAYELRSYMLEKDDPKASKDICRSSHVSSMLCGLAAGLLWRKRFA